MSTPAEKLLSLRSAMRAVGIDIYIIPMSDPHLGEYIPEHWQIIRWLTGFTGSAGTVVVTAGHAGLWTDSRYFIQAERQLAGSGFEFMRPGQYQRNDYMDFVVENAGSGEKIGFDGSIFPISAFRRLEKRLEGRKIVFETSCDLISDLWPDRPSLPFSMAFDHALEYCGKGRAEKLRELREQMRKSGAAYHLLSSPDDIMWLLNIRGNDLKYSPLLLSFALAGQEQLLLFVDQAKIPPMLAAEFDRLGIVLLPYEDATEIVHEVIEGESVLLNPQNTSVDLFRALAKKSGCIEEISIPARLKSIKNLTEIANIEKVMVKDGAALTRFLFWFENNHGSVDMTEDFLSEKVNELRAEQEGFLMPSFETIVAFNENSALPHYHAEKGSGAAIGDRGILLVDSGGQYPGGTTDITRTVAIGIPSAQQISDFTLVLKGHINLALSKFPEGTRGYQLDLVARRAMWGSGMNYAHGTGHGIGYCLNVHEGPQSISPADNKTAIEEGMLTSNEPAIYREGEYGIRTENLILCYSDEETEFGKFLRFETVSLCYIDKSLIDKSLLERHELDWLNAYHAEVFERLSPHLSEAEKVWLKEKTEAL